MGTSDSYLTIKSEADAEIRIKASRFIGQARPCGTESQALEILESIRKKYYDATHNCFAYRTGTGKETSFRYSDDGEPSGTAGKPIFDRIDGQNLTNLIVVVTRYFGGTKLGTGGLTHAYSDAAGEALSKAGIIERFITGQIPLTLEFSDYNIVERLIHHKGGKIISSDFSNIVQLTVEIRQSLIEILKSELIDTTSGRIRFG